ncbi:MarR family transcriptional regulator [Actinomadura kijaniata]|uniref:DNA-binding MarR family transcriptional regulator n=1 Tax=Actinomadura namibiensis TaxID=182080 RepID=A0A7W3LI55_ACTNM|nr:MarR family transcriptional regulator [Actinomadura namibiensis]MBA8948500.1 DNA-binding MarR family transcriptional regulator [Actinomadura namibiensis]
MSDAATRALAEHFNARLRDVVLLLRRVNADQPVTSQQLAVLGSLDGGPRRMTELAEEQGVRLPTMTAQINRLERDGLVRRGRDAADARVVTVELTGAGAEHLRTGRARRVDFLADRLAALSPDDREAIAAALPALDRLFAPERKTPYARTTT